MFKYCRWVLGNGRPHIRLHCTVSINIYDPYNLVLAYRHINGFVLNHLLHTSYTDVIIESCYSIRQTFKSLPIFPFKNNSYSIDSCLSLPFRRCFHDLDNCFWNFYTFDELNILWTYQIRMVWKVLKQMLLVLIPNVKKWYRRIS